MGIAFVKDTNSASVTTDTITVPTGGFAAGNLVVLGGFWDDQTSTVSAINDTGGNAYSAAQTIAASSRTATIWYSLLTTGLSAGDTIVASLAGNDGAWIAAEFSGISASPLDQAPTGNTDTGTTSHTSGTTGTTSQADELLVGFHATNSALTTYTATGGFTINEQYQPFSFTLSMQYLIVSSTGTYASTCTTPVNANTSSLIATFKAAAAVQQIRPDADIVTTGWATAPLFSKINESSADGTVITATAS